MPVLHCKGLRQGDPLSPLLFIIAIDPLHRLLQAAGNQGLLQPLPGREIKLRVSLYADDAVIFANPIKEEIETLMQIVHSFGEATGLKINLQKSTATPIRCSEINLEQVLQSFGGQQASFPLLYLGLKITIKRIRLVHLQFILDRIRARLAGWKGKLMSIAARRVLVRAVLSSLPTFALTALRVPKKFLKEVDKSRRRFLWAQEEELSGGKCKVNWSKVCSPVEYGGLGVLDLEKFNRALRLRWLWHSWKKPDRPWVGMEVPCDDREKAAFSAMTTITIGDGSRATFWCCAWAGVEPLKLSFPRLFKHSRRKNRTVQAALHANTWIKDLAHGDTNPLLQEFSDMERLIREARAKIRLGQPDEIKWKLTANGQYSASSAYRAQFQGSLKTPFRAVFWSAWAPGRLKIFSWLLHLNRLWCNDRLQRRGWENQYFCQLCFRHLESSVHLFWQCEKTRAVWEKVSTWNGCQAVSSATWNSLHSSIDIVERIINSTATSNRKGIKTIVTLVLWEIWLERNQCTFRGKVAHGMDVLTAARRSIDLWRQAGAKCLELPFAEPPAGIG